MRGAKEEGPVVSPSNFCFCLWGGFSFFLFNGRRVVVLLPTLGRRMFSIRRVDDYGCLIGNVWFLLVRQGAATLCGLARFAF